MIAEWEAVKVLLEEAGLEGRIKDTVTDEHGEAVRGDYVVLFRAAPDGLDDGRYGSVPRPDSDADYSFAVRAVSGDPGGVQALIVRVLRLTGQKPQVAGRRADRVYVEVDPPKVDQSVKPPLFYQDAWVQFTSRRG